MQIELNMAPEEAWRTFLKGSVDLPKWLEQSTAISDSVGLSRRELLGLILYSYYLSKDGRINVCWNSEDSEPNDGYLISTDGHKIQCEHKVIPQFNNSKDVMRAIEETYEKYATRGKAYGSDRHLIIHPNIPSKGLARISKLHEGIREHCIFDKVFLASVNGFEAGGIIRFFFSEQFPGLTLRHLRINKKTGELQC